jgi:hypothetical protein
MKAFSDDGVLGETSDKLYYILNDRKVPDIMLDLLTFILDPPKVYFNSRAKMSLQSP